MSYKPPLPDFHPSIQKVGAIVTTRWNGKAYRPLQITSLESYYIDTALDNDADTWTCTIGDPDGLYKALLLRDNEVRVHLYGTGHEGMSPILTGIDDDVEFQDGSFTLTGRDLSSLAVDSTPLPKKWAKARAWAIVKSQAHELGFHKTQLSHTGIVKKSQYTDGSESYWDFWYRLYRQEKMWLWTLPDGTLYGGPLAYGDDPIYYIGDPKASDGAHILNRIIPVETAVLTKSTQPRLYEVVVYGTRGHQGKGANGEIGFNVTAKDPTISKWQKRPRKVILDSQSHTPNAARRAAWEEIYEGKVGAVEFKITIPDPGFIIRPNKIARLNLKEIDLHGDYYVVGTRVQGGPDGFVQEIRLRERGMALSKRVPTAPKLDTGGSGTSTAASVGAALEQGGIPKGWGNYFVKAAKQYHNPMDYSLFLATLLAICDTESGFQNERQLGGPGGDHIEWYPYAAPTNLPQPGVGGRGGSGAQTRSDWERQFANEPGVYGISQYHPWGPPPGQGGVGPMQLTSIGLKQAADDLLRRGHRNQYDGGRWHPEHNIMIGARTLHNDVQGVHAIRDSDIWIAVMAYNMGVAGAQSYYSTHKTLNSYATEIKKKVLNSPGYLAQVQAAEAAAQQAGSASSSNPHFTNPFPNGWLPNRLDMGWDGTFKQKIVAPFPGTIMYAGVMQGWKGSKGVVIHSDIAFGLQFSDTNTLFFTEGVSPTVKAGDHVSAGQTIARPARNPYNGIVGNIEWGVAGRAKVGVQPNAEALLVRRPSDMVVEFYHWAKKTLHVPGQATDMSNAGYP